MVMMILAYLSLAVGPSLPVEVDPRTELVAIVFRLAGSDAYVRPQSKSPYAGEVLAWFGEVRDHDAVQIAKRLRFDRGISYDAPMTLAVHLDSWSKLELDVPLDPWPERLDRRWDAASIAEFLPALRDFAEVSRFGEFFAAHRELYAETARRLQAVLQDEELLPWAESYFGEEAGSDTVVLVGLLQGGHNFGCGVRRADGSLKLCPILGAWEWDERGVPVFSAKHVPLAAHEFAHAFVNPVIDAAAPELDRAGDALFESARVRFESQAYGHGRVVLYESLVRSAAVRYVASRGRAAEAHQMALADVKSGFRWVPDLVQVLADEYEADRDTYPDLASFTPRLVEFFRGQADGLAAHPDGAPKVVSTTPANGDLDVDPGVTAIQVVFSEAMKDGSWSMMKGEGLFPEVAGKPSFDRTRKVFTLPVKLVPGTRYTFGINGPGAFGFTSERGVPAIAVSVTFRTRDAP